MSNNHEGGNVVPEITREEHSNIGGIDGKRVFIFDNAGNQVTNFSGSGGAGATVSIGSSATIFAVVNTSAAGQASVVLDTGTKFIGLATVVQGAQTPTGTNYIGLASVNIGGTLPALSSGANFIGLATVVQGNQPALIASSAYIGLVSVNIGGTLPALTAGTAFIGLTSVQGNVNLNAGANYVGLASVNIGGTLPALSAGANYIGLASVNVGNTINSITTIAPRTDYIGLMSVSGNVGLNAGANFIGLISTASINGKVDIIAALPAGVNYVGLASVNIGGTLPALSSGANYIGLASVNVGNTINSITTIAPRTDYIGLMSVSGNVGLNTGTNFIGLASVQGNINLNTGANFIGLVTVIPTYLSTYTSLATTISATGLTTIFAPPSGKRFIIKDLFISSQGKCEITVTSNAAQLVPWTSLATYGGYVINAGDSGIRGKANDDLFGVQLNGIATISVMANVRFE